MVEFRSLLQVVAVDESDQHDNAIIIMMKNLIKCALFHEIEYSLKNLAEICASIILNKKISVVFILLQI